MSPRLAKTGFLALVAAAVAVAAAGIRREGVETDLFALIGAPDGVEAALARKTAGQVRILCDDAAAAERCRALAPLDAPEDPDALLELVRTHGRGLLGPRSRDLLAAGETNRIARSTLRRDYSGVGLFPREDDPHYFLSDFVMELGGLRPELREGQRLLTGSLSPTGDARAIGRLLDLARTDPRVHLSGAPFHAFLAAESSKREINALGAVSLVVAFALGAVLFRGFRFVLPLALALAAGFAVGLAAVTLLPGRPHALTFVFGTTLIGLGVDYCYHGLFRARAGGPRGDFPKLLAAALATTVLAFAPLAFSSVALLNQMALFTVSGLVTVAAAVMLWFGKSS